MDFLGVFSLRMLKWDAIDQRKSVSIVQAVFTRATKQVIVGLKSTMNEYHLMVGIEKARVVMPVSAKKTHEKRTSDKVIE